MLNSDYLLMGLDGLSRAHEGDYFRDGHFAASIIAAYYLCHENNLENRTQLAIKSRIDKDFGEDILFLSASRENPDPSLITQLLRTLERGACDLREVGHNVIFAAAALKAFQSLPDSITAFRIDGISKLIAAFDTTQNVEVDPCDEIPEILEKKQLIELIFHEYLRSVALYTGFGQGGAGHLLTFGHAVIELWRLGYPELATRAYQGYRMYIKTIRGGPKETGRHIPEHPHSSVTPLEYEYWKKRKSVRPGLGHAFKYPYSFYNLLAKLEDLDLRQRCLNEGYRIF